MTQAEIPAFLVELEETFNQAMISNDIERISRCITDDWILVTPEAGPVPRSRILDVIGSGFLTHATMTKTATPRACRSGHCLTPAHAARQTGSEP